MNTLHLSLCGHLSPMFRLHKLTTPWLVSENFLKIRKHLQVSLYNYKIMPQQIIVLKVHMRCEQCRTKALRIAAKAYGVTGMRLEGEDQERLAVEGRHVNIAKLVRTLKKKVGFTEILHVSDFYHG